MKYSIKVSEVKNGSENLRGIASVTLGDSFKLNNIKIMNDPREEGKLFVAMPSYKDNQGEYKDIFNPTTKEFRDELYGNLLDAFQELTENQAKNSYTVEYDKKDTAMPDFSVRVTPYTKEGSSIRGMASINFNGLTVHNVTINQGKDNLFPSMPSYKTNQVENGKPVYKDVCHPVTAKFREKLNGAILQAYDQALEAGKEAGRDSVASKLEKNKEAVEKKDQQAKTAKGKDTKEQQQKRDDMQR